MDWTDCLTMDELNFESDRTQKILKQMLEELELAIIKAKAQLEYVEA